jgi:hypothetical protein
MPKYAQIEVSTVKITYSLILHRGELTGPIATFLILPFYRLIIHVSVTFSPHWCFSK